MGGGSRGIKGNFSPDSAINYIIETTLIGEDNNANYQITLKDGSGILRQSNSAKSQFATLQEILQKHKFNANFIKVDTDGFDFKVLRSGMEFIKSHRPSLYFEWDRTFLEAQGEDYLSIFAKLADCGYGWAVIFDNFGYLLCAVDICDRRNLTLLMRYTTHSKQNIYYYDVLLLGDNLSVDEFVAEFYKV